MLSRTTKVGLAAAAAGAAMLLMSAAPASAFTLSCPSPAANIASSDIQDVQWGWHHWHHCWHCGWHHWHHRHCWPTPWGVRCRWW